MKKVLGIFALAVSLMLTTGMASATSFQTNWEGDGTGHASISLDDSHFDYSYRNDWAGNVDGAIGGSVAGDYINDISIGSRVTGSGYARDSSEFNGNWDYLSQTEYEIDDYNFKSTQEFETTADSYDIRDNLGMIDAKGRGPGYGNDATDDAFAHSQGFRLIGADGFYTNFEAEDQYTGESYSNSMDYSSVEDSRGRTWAETGRGKTDFRAMNYADDIPERHYEMEIANFDSGGDSDFDFSWTK